MPGLVSGGDRRYEYIYIYIYMYMYVYKYIYIYINISILDETISLTMCDTLFFRFHKMSKVKTNYGRTEKWQRVPKTGEHSFEQT